MSSGQAPGTGAGARGAPGEELESQFMMRMFIAIGTLGVE